MSIIKLENETEVKNAIYECNTLIDRDHDEMDLEELMDTEHRIEELTESLEEYYKRA